MKRIITFLCVISMLLCASSVSAAPANANDFEWQTLKITNQNRKEHGLLPLTTFESLQSAADVRAAEIDPFYSHTRPDGSSCFTVLEEKNIEMYSAGENIAKGQFTPEQVMEDWMNSTGHRANILHSEFKHLGVGYFKGKDENVNGGIMYGHCWVQLFVGGCQTTKIEISGKIETKNDIKNANLKVTCDLHGISYMPLESANYSIANGMITVNYDGKSTSKNISDMHTFNDVNANAYYVQAVDWAVKNNITSGTSDTTFGPDESCTRAQAVTFLWRLAGRPQPTKQDMPFKDIEKGAYYYDAVLWAVENGITSGTTDTTFEPNAKCTRAQIVSFIYRAEKAESVKIKNPFKDVKKDAYYYNAVLWAVNEGITSGTSNTTFSPADNCTRAQIVSFLYRYNK